MNLEDELMSYEDYKKLLAIEEVNTFFTKIYKCWEELENNNESNKELALKEIKEKFNSLSEELKEKNTTVNKMNIFDNEVFFDSFIGNDFFGVYCSKKGNEIKFSEEDMEFVRMFVLKNKSSNIPVELQSPSETRYKETIKKLKKVKRKKINSKMKRNVYNLISDFTGGDYSAAKYFEESDNVRSLSQEYKQILNDQRKIEFFKELTFEQYNAFLECYDCFCKCNDSYEEMKNIEKNLNETMYISDEDMYEKVLSELLEKELITQQEIKKVKFHILNFLFFKDEELIFPNQVIKNISVKQINIIDLFIASQGLVSYSNIFAREVYNTCVENEDKILSKVSL